MLYKLAKNEAGEKCVLWCGKEKIKIVVHSINNYTERISELMFKAKIT